MRLGRRWKCILPPRQKRKRRPAQVSAWLCGHSEENPSSRFVHATRRLLLQPRRGIWLPFYDPLLPSEYAVAGFEKGRHDGREEGGHDYERSVDFSIFRPALCPT